MSDVLYDSHTWVGAIVALFIFSLITFAVLLVAWWWDHRKASKYEERPAVAVYSAEYERQVRREQLQEAFGGYTPRRLLEDGDTVEQEPVR